MAPKKRRRQKGEGSLFQRGDGRWVATVELGWKNQQRDTRRFYGASPEEALLAKRQFLRAREDGFTVPKGRTPTVGEWMRHWLHNIAQARVEPSTWHQRYRPQTLNHIIPFFENTRLTTEQLDEDLIHAFHTHLAGRGLSPTTVRDIHQILSTALRVAVARGRLMRNPCSEASPPEVEREEIQTPQQDEVDEILEEIAGRRQGVRWLVAMTVGVRQGEALGLTWPYVDVADPDNAHISIQWSLTRLPWEHGCDDPHQCGYRRRVEPGKGYNGADKVRGTYHRMPCPPGCTLTTLHTEHLRPCKGEPCTAHGHGPDCKPGCQKTGHLCPCPSDCTGHAAACPRRRGGGLGLKRPKSAKSRREIHIPRVVALALRRHRAAQAEERLGLGGAWEGWAHTGHGEYCPAGCTAHCDRATRRRERVCPDCRKPTKPDGLVFAQPTGRPVDKRRDWEEWRAILQRLDLDDYRIHDLRHRAATKLLERGLDVRVVQQVLGHASPAFTQSTYQHVTERLQRQAAAGMAHGLESWTDTQSDTLEGAEHGKSWHA